MAKFDRIMGTFTKTIKKLRKLEKKMDTKVTKKASKSVKVIAKAKRKASAIATKGTMKSTKLLNKANDFDMEAVRAGKMAGKMESFLDTNDE
jgi:hypothetical protein